MQRSGRCGRVADGICIRLYSEDDFDGRPEFTEPEILRTSLASVILQMTSLGLGDVRRFPFVDPPDARQVADGIRLLEELGALRHRGRQAAAGTVGADAGSRHRHDAGPAAARPAPGPDAHRGRTSSAAPARCSSSSRPCRSRTRASGRSTSRHRPTSRTRGSGTSTPTSPPCSCCGATSGTSRRRCAHSAFRRMCKAEYLHYLRVREWQDLHAQLRTRAARMSASTPTSAPPRATRSPTGPRPPGAARRAAVAHRRSATRPGATTRGSRRAVRHLPRFDPVPAPARPTSWPPSWSRPPGSGRASTPRIDPEWAEQVGAHLVAAQLVRAALVRKEGAAVATERVTLYGVPLVGRPHDPVRPDQPRGGPRAVHPLRAGRGRLGDPARLLERNVATLARGSPSSRSARAGATSSSTTRCCSRSTTAGSRPTCSPSGTSTAGGAASDDDAPTCSPSPRTTSPRDGGGGGLGRRLPAHLAAGRPRPRRHLPVRARCGRRRGDACTCRWPCSTG